MFSSWVLLFRLRFHQFWKIFSSADFFCQLEPFWHLTFGYWKVTWCHPFVRFAISDSIAIFWMFLHMLFIEYFIYLHKKWWYPKIRIFKMRCSILILYSMLGFSETRKVSFLFWHFITKNTCHFVTKCCFNCFNRNNLYYLTLL